MRHSSSSQCPPCLRGESPNSLPGWIGLLAGVLAIAVVWLVILPAVGRRPEVAARIDRLDARGIDPSAMFYTELEVMPEVERHIERVHRKDPQLLWVPRWDATR